MEMTRCILPPEALLPLNNCPCIEHTLTPTVQFVKDQLAQHSPRRSKVRVKMKMTAKDEIGGTLRDPHSQRCQTCGPARDLVDQNRAGDQSHGRHGDRPQVASDTPHNCKRSDRMTGRSTTANGMVRPCTCPASKRSWQGAPKTRSTPCLRHPIPRSPRSASISARTRSTSWATMRAAPSCCGKSGRVAKWRRGLPIYRLAGSAWKPASAHIT